MITSGQSPDYQASPPALGVGFELSAVAMALLDDTLRIVSANPAAGRMLGTEDLVGQSIIEFSVPAGAESAAWDLAPVQCGELTHLEHAADLRTSTGEVIHACICWD